MQYTQFGIRRIIIALMCVEYRNLSPLFMVTQNQWNGLMDWLLHILSYNDECEEGKH